MTDLDHLLAELGRVPPDPRLGDMDEAVLAGAEAARRPVLSGAGLGAVAALAMMAGVLASALPSGGPLAATPYPPGVPRDLAPSTLLGETP